MRKRMVIDYIERNHPEVEDKDSLAAVMDIKAVRDKQIMRYYLKELQAQQKSIAQIYAGIEYHFGVSDRQARRILNRVIRT